MSTRAMTWAERSLRLPGGAAADREEAGLAGPPTVRDPEADPVGGREAATEGDQAEALVEVREVVRVVPRVMATRARVVPAGLDRANGVEGRGCRPGCSAI